MQANLLCTSYLSQLKKAAVRMQCAAAVAQCIPMAVQATLHTAAQAHPPRTPTERALQVAEWRLPLW